MTTYQPDFELNRPGALIAALPAVLGFVPENSLVLVSLDGGELGAVMRVDLSEELTDRIVHLAEIAAGAQPEAAIAVIVDADGAHCPGCNEEYRQLCAELAEALSQHDIQLRAGHVVDRVAKGGRWHCVDGCGSGGTVDDPSASPLAAAAVLDGRRLYSRRADLQAVIAVDDPARSADLTDALRRQAATRERAHRADPAGCGRRDVEDAMAAASRVAGGQTLSGTELSELGCALSDGQVRDTLYALAVGAPAIVIQAGPTSLIGAGLLVGFGTRLGGGCTSGHGVCGLARLSRRSIVATGVFMACAVVTVFLTRHTFGV